MIRRSYYITYTHQYAKVLVKMQNTLSIYLISLLLLSVFLFFFLSWLACSKARMFVQGSKQAKRTCDDCMSALLFTKETSNGGCDGSVSSNGSTSNSNFNDHCCDVQRYELQEAMRVNKSLLQDVVRFVFKCALSFCSLILCCFYIVSTSIIIIIIIIAPPPS